METKLFDELELTKIKDIILNGEVVGFPTETVYGLGVIFDNEDAFNKMMEAKNRPPHKPFTLMCDSIDTIEQYAFVNDKTKLFLSRYMPGALTVLLPVKEGVPYWVTLGSSVIGVRISSHPFVLNLIKEVGKPLLVPSANKSDQPPLVEYKDVIKEFDGDISAIVTSNAYGESPSTIVFLENDMIKLIREGAIPFNELESTWRNL